MKTLTCRASTAGVYIAFSCAPFGEYRCLAHSKPHLKKEIPEKERFKSNKTKDIDEVVIVGYGKQKKVNLTGAVASVSAKQLESRPITNFRTRGFRA